MEDGLLEIVHEMASEKNVVAHGEVENLLVGAQFSDGHVHVHYPQDPKNAEYIIRTIEAQTGRNIRIFSKEDVKTIAKEVKDAFLNEMQIVPSSSSQGNRPQNDIGRKIIFSHGRALGDEVMFTSGIRDFKLLFPDIAINVEGKHKALWENNPYLDRSLKEEDPDVEFYRVGYKAINSANNTYVHFTQMFLLDMIAMADAHKPLSLPLGEFCSTFGNGEVGDPCIGNLEKNSASKEPFISWVNKYKNFSKKFSRMRGDLHLTDKEKADNVVKSVYGVDKYWVIAPGGKTDCTTKIWDWRKFQQVVNHFKGKLTFVVIGKSDLVVEKLEGVLDLTDRYNEDIRGLLSLVYNADGCVSGPSALMHLAAALPREVGTGENMKLVSKPCVTILGGREPTGWTWYTKHQILHTNGIFSCCEDGACWRARTYSLPNSPEHNKSLCSKPISVDGRTIQECMEVITEHDVIRAIEKYYEGDLRSYDKGIVQEKKAVVRAIPEVVHENQEVVQDSSEIVQVQGEQKEINLLGNLNSKGGGEQSLCMIAKMFREAGWKVNLIPWGSVNEKFAEEEVAPFNFIDDHGKTMEEKMTCGIPLLFYANDCVWDFPKYAEGIVSRSSMLIVGINYAIGGFKRCDWLNDSGKLKAVIFQNEEKREEWVSQVFGYLNTELIVLFGAVDIDKFYSVNTSPRNKDMDMVVLKHCVADARKFVTEESKSQGEKCHVWQKHMFKDTDVVFYGKILKEMKNIRFEFMEAHSELVHAFKKESRMVFHKWDSMSVESFLSRGHVYLYRTSNAWRDQYPRTVAEALAVGLPVLTEPRDGTKDRVVHGDTGLYCIDYDSFLYGLKLLQRKDDYRVALGRNAKKWARKNLDPHKWVDVIGKIVKG